MILAVPVLAIGALTGLNVASAAGRAADAGQARELVVVGGTSALLVMQLQHERAAASIVFTEASSPSALADYRRQGAATDVAVTEFRAEVSRIHLPANVVPLIARVDSDLAGLAGLREKVIAAPDAVLSVVAFRYRAVIADLLAYRQALGQIGVGAATANGLRSAAALSQAIESLGQLQVAAVRALAGGPLTPAGQQEIVAADTALVEALQTFTDLGPAGWRATLNSRIGGGPQIVQAERLQGLVTRAQPGAVLELGTNARGWTAAVGARIDVMHTVEADLDGQLLTAVTAERDAEQRTIYTASAAVALVLLVVIAFGFVVARSLTRSLRRLQAGALDVAVHRLPQMVAELDVDHADPAAVDQLLAQAGEPIAVDGTDEVGRVAEAFNQVTASAVRIAGEQAAARAAIGAILVSLSRRLQLRADAMIVSLDGLEREEEDPDRLKNLFDLDHIATLIRRLIANLQILAGGRGGRPRDGGVPLAKLMQAALQEIDAYARVRAVDIDDSVEVNGAVADELIQLLAELLDNAACYSRPDTLVTIEARPVGDQLHIQIRDRGEGMGEAELALARDRVANPSLLDYRTTRQMGLPVVGLVAQRLGITIAFRPVVGNAGTVVDLTLPSQLFHRRRSEMQHPTVVLRSTAGNCPPGGHEPTAELATVTPRILPGPPSTWPPIPAPALPATAEPVIYEQLRSDPSRTWFHQPTPDESTSPALVDRELVGVGAGWQAAARAAEAAGSTAPTQTTASGLPVRQPGGRLIPQTLRVAAAPVPRQPDRSRAQMTAFQHGLGLAGRRLATPQQRTARHDDQP